MCEILEQGPETDRALIKDEARVSDASGEPARQEETAGMAETDNAGDSPALSEDAACESEALEPSGLHNDEAAGTSCADTGGKLPAKKKADIVKRVVTPGKNAAGPKSRSKKMPPLPAKKTRVEKTEKSDGADERQIQTDDKAQNEPRRTLLGMKWKAQEKSGEQSLMSSNDGELTDGTPGRKTSAGSLTPKEDEDVRKAQENTGGQAASAKDAPHNTAHGDAEADNNAPENDSENAPNAESKRDRADGDGQDHEIGLQLDMLTDEEDSDIQRPVDHAFEGTNEVYVRSSAFDALREDIDAVQHPVDHAFEGTNEVYIRSSVFDALREDIALGENGDGSNSGLTGSRLLTDGARIKPPTVARKNSGANIIGIVSGVLPTVELDKSFDMAAISEDAAETPADSDAGNDSVPPGAAAQDAPAKSHKSDSLAMYLSRMGNALNSSKSLVVNVSGSRLGLPSPSAVRENACVHPENAADAAALRRTGVRFASDYLFDPRILDIGQCEIDSKVDLHESTYTALSLALIDSQDCGHPKVMHLTSPCDMTARRVVREFLRRCLDNTPDFSCYTQACPPSGRPIDLVTALVSSRIGCFPGDAEDVKSETLIKNSSAIFAPSDMHWGLDILLVRYGLGHLVTQRKNSDLAQMQIRNASDMRELLLNIVQRDAASGPVVIAIPVQPYGEETAWRDVLSWLRGMSCGNILILLTGSYPENTDERLIADIEEYEIPELTRSESRAIIKTVLGTGCISGESAARIAEAAGGRYDCIRRMISVLREHDAIVPGPGRTENPKMTAEVQAFKGGADVIEQACFDAFGEDERSFLCWASALGDTFYLGDLTRMMELEPLPDEPLWSNPLRTAWCEKTAAALVGKGELVELGWHSVRGAYYAIPESAMFRRMMAKIGPEFVTQIYGCNGGLLVRIDNTAPDRAMAQFARAGLWHKFVEQALLQARIFADRFENKSALSILERCLLVVGPESGDIYAEVLRAHIDICRRTGEFNAAVMSSRSLLSYAKFIRNDTMGCLAMIGHGDLLRILGLREESQKYHISAVELSEKTADENLIADAYEGLARLVFESGEKGAFVNALRYAEKALEIYRRGGELDKIAACQTLCAKIFMYRGEPERARNAVSEAYYAMMVSGRWYDTPQALIVMADCARAFNDGLPLDYIDRGMEIVNKTGNILDRISLIFARIQILMKTLERQQVRRDLDSIDKILEIYPFLPWKTYHRLLIAQFDFVRKNFKKTTHALKDFFDLAQQLGNSYLLSCGYLLSAEVNLEVHKRNLGSISVDKTEKLHISATAMFESIGAWHRVAESLRSYAEFLKYFKRGSEVDAALMRAERVDPYCQ